MEQFKGNYDTMLYTLLHNHVLHCIYSILFADASWMTWSHILNPGIYIHYLSGFHNNKFVSNTYSVLLVYEP